MHDARRESCRAALCYSNVKQPTAPMSSPQLRRHEFSREASAVIASAGASSLPLVGRVDRSVARSGWGYSRQASSFPRRATHPSSYATSPSMKRAQETPDAKPHPQPRMRMKKAYERSHHRFGRPTRRFLRNGFNGFFRDLPGDRAFLPPSPARRERPVRAFIAIPLT